MGAPAAIPIAVQRHLNLSGCRPPPFPPPVGGHSRTPTRPSASQPSFVRVMRNVRPGSSGPSCARVRRHLHDPHRCAASLLLPRLPAPALSAMLARTPTTTAAAMSCSFIGSPPIEGPHGDPVIPLSPGHWRSPVKISDVPLSSVPRSAVRGGRSAMRLGRVRARRAGPAGPGRRARRTVCHALGLDGRWAVRRGAAMERRTG